MFTSWMWSSTSWIFIFVNLFHASLNVTIILVIDDSWYIIYASLTVSLMQIITQFLLSILTFSPIKWWENGTCGIINMWQLIIICVVRKIFAKLYIYIASWFASFNSFVHPFLLRYFYVYTSSVISSTPNQQNSPCYFSSLMYLLFSASFFCIIYWFV